MQESVQEEPVWVVGQNEGGGGGRKTSGFEVRKNRILGAGSFWTVHAARDLRTGADVVVKLQSATLDARAMAAECAFLARLKDVEGVAPVLGWGVETGRFNWVAMPRLGPSLQTLLEHCGGTFSIQTVLHLGVRLFSRLREIHRRGILHRDIKPENLLVDRDSRLFVVDFGFAKQYLVRQSDSSMNSSGAQADGSKGRPTNPGADLRVVGGPVHIPPKGGKRFVGTPLFAPICVHEGRESGRKDDLESALYVLIYFYHGRLPWSDLPATDAKTDPKRPGEWYPAAAALKRKITAADLIAGDWSTLPSYLLSAAAPHENPQRPSLPPMPRCFSVLLNYLFMLRFKETPSYRYMIELLQGEIVSNEGEAALLHPPRYDWFWK